MQVMQKRNNWFVSYQTISGKPGQRDLNYRKDFFQIEDFTNRSVLDVGCNLGQMCKFAYDLGASNIMGMDYDESVIKMANSLLTTDESTKITYLTDDVDNYAFYTKLPMFDTILLLSVIETVELQNRFGMLAKLSALCKVMYFEGHINSIYSNLLKMLLNYTTFTTIEFKGIQYDNIDFQNKNKGRHVFRCSNQKYNVTCAQNKVLQLIENNSSHIITIVGNGGVGKSHFKHKLIDYINKNSRKFQFDENKTKYTDENNIVHSENKVIEDNTGELCIIDDVVLQDSDILKYKYVIYFDYKALTYLTSNVNTIFFMNTDLMQRYNNREEKYKYHRSPHMNDSLLSHINNIYHIDNTYT